MFDRIAGVYDLMNSVMTAGLHHRWRAARSSSREVGPGRRVLDVATGTGDLAIELARRVGPGGEVIGSDFSEEMLDAARGPKAPARRQRFEWGDALALPYADGAFDAATVGFGARNFSDLDRGPGRDGARRAPRRPRVVPRDHHAAAAAAVDLLPLGSTASVPLSARLAGDHGAYTYLPNSVKRFPGARGAGGGWSARACATPLGADRRRDHRDPRRRRSSRASGP